MHLKAAAQAIWLKSGTLGDERPWALTAMKKRRQAWTLSLKLVVTKADSEETLTSESGASANTSGTTTPAPEGTSDTASAATPGVTLPSKYTTFPIDSS
ncbi:hypothetical protein CPB84DRAFT_1845728 [Gymnopilus junonius]|uniref:Uncharacterized protein n=1 Tax=Gymnopilus junonius TaxID=109634 RepID=A0A9P5NSZ0_GYMJU|nr:hypothetical protein CPB84DRAFT_1845728 [Gymnopilus junonius]